MSANASSGSSPPSMLVPFPGPATVAAWERYRAVAAPMGPPAAWASPGAVVFAAADGANVWDVDGNRYVDLAAGFGSLLLGHRPAAVARAVEAQLGRLLQAMGDVHPSDVRVALTERLAALGPGGVGRVLLGQSGADAVTLALESAVLATGRAGVVAFRGAYHGLGHGPLPLCGLRESYRAPFGGQLGQHVRFVDFPSDDADGARSLDQVEQILRAGTVGAVVIEPIQGRAGVLIPPRGYLPALAEATRRHGALLVADEIWTGLGRSGAWLRTRADGVEPDLVCLGKGLGGGLPLSACVGREDVMLAWSRPAEVVHTATFTGAPLACAAALALLSELARVDAPLRAATVGDALVGRLREALRPSGAVRAIRGVGLMVAVELAAGAGAAVTAARRLLERGYIVSTGGGQREALVLTPPLDVEPDLLEPFVDALAEVLGP